VSHPFSPTALTIANTKAFSLKINHICLFNGIPCPSAKNSQSSSGYCGPCSVVSFEGAKVISRSVSILTSPLWPSLFCVDTAALRARPKWQKAIDYRDEHREIGRSGSVKLFNTS